jgi:hypothetical protein
MLRIRMCKSFTLKVNDELRKLSKTEVHETEFESMQLVQFSTKLVQTNCRSFQMEKQVEWRWFDGLKQPRTPGRPLSFNGGQGRALWSV